MRYHGNMSETPQVKPLWTRDFTILTLGSVVSMFGNVMSGFAMSLLVLDYTASTFLYAVYVAVFTIPQILVPMFSGAVLDRFSRRRTIYTLDFISSVLYLSAAWILHSGWFSFPILAVYVFVVGCIHSIYQVAYQSFYPLLISEGNYFKAYSISGVLETLSAVMVPVAAYFYHAVGIAPLLAVNAACFFIAAVFETQIRQEEKYIEIQKEHRTSSDARKQVLDDIKEGTRYILHDRGLTAIALYFTCCAVGYGASSVLVLPYFRSTYANGEYIYMVVQGMAIAGRGLGGMFHYRIRMPKEKKFAIAMMVYFMTNLLEAFYLYTAIPVMACMMFISGLMGVTSYTIRIAATQSYVPDEKKGRFNGAFNMLNTVGSLSGELICGALGVYMSSRSIIFAVMMLNMIAAYVFIFRSRHAVAEIYNTET